MLQAIRSRTGSWIARILLFLLILGFGAWGISDMLIPGVGGPQDTAVEVGDVTVGVDTVVRQLNVQVSQLRQSYGPDFSIERAISMGVLDRVLDAFVVDGLTTSVADAIGITPPLAAVQQAIQDNPAFADPVTGQFNLDYYQSVLGNAGLTEAAYAGSIAQSAMRRAVTTGLLEAGATPEAVLAPLAAYRTETRAVTALTISAEGLLPDFEPTDGQVTAHFEENGQNYMTPEYRRISAVLWRPSDFTDILNVGEEDISASYEAQQDRFDLPERRAFDQVVVSSLEEAEAVREAATEGRTLADALEAAEVAASVVELPLGSREELSLPELADPGFALVQGEISEVIESPLGFHLMELTVSEPAGLQTLEEVHDLLQDELTEELALNHVYDLANSYDDATAGGEDLTEGAIRAGLNVISLGPIARDGTVREGTEPLELAEAPSLAGLAFSLEDGESSNLQELDAGTFFAVKVDAILPPEARPIDAVREEVADAVARQERTAEAERIGQEINDAVEGGETLAGAAETHGLVPETIAAMRRDGSARDSWPRNLVGEVFAAQPGDLIQGAAPAGWVIGQLDSVAEAEEDVVDAERERIEQDFTGAIGSDLLEQMVQSWREEWNPRVVPDAVTNYMFPQDL